MGCLLVHVLLLATCRNFYTFLDFGFYVSVHSRSTVCRSCSNVCVTTNSRSTTSILDAFPKDGRLRESNLEPNLSSCWTLLWKWRIGISKAVNSNAMLLPVPDSDLTSLQTRFEKQDGIPQQDIGVSSRGFGIFSCSSFDWFPCRPAILSHVLFSWPKA